MRLYIKAVDVLGAPMTEHALTTHEKCIEIMQMYYRNWQLGLISWAKMTLKSLDEKDVATVELDAR